MRTGGKVLAVASGGGHWVQLMRLRPALEGYEVAYCSVHPEYAEQVPGCRLHVVHDSNAKSKWGVLRTALGILWVLLKERPAVVLSTGAAPGGLALFFAKKLGAKTIWIDSIANAEVLSLSGQKAGRYADLWLTQWPELAADGGPEYSGSVL
ncbi:MAG: UDP-N-acetylglucosamine--LPS N-acetylglucosamine transferase [Planctomycetes bacterium]|nr:UDP-N-acetylglucosamine--LPS N-acetylglucosamine transferase [Planctomycetota bacterium]MCB9911074.1 UDP-N-acetylglucosamine--LPS N-acetylglucosamine transferase [Planctomycetota bacterium]MCB9912176.1 UDP-N-acetylglucosamine--LPS N-acetylglucosamine transferase [Planctomycetota bacterium]HPF13098.1 UDP-N-acetylglucosamine--LPS N-acetylglucosamine transferase [Planctomycetota bacterium]